MRKRFLCSVFIICCFVFGCSRKEVIENPGSKEPVASDAATTSNTETTSDAEINSAAETTQGVETTSASDHNDSQPVNGCSLQLPTLPVAISNTDSNGGALTTVSIEEVEYEFTQNKDGTYLLKLLFNGVKTYEKKNQNLVYNVYAFALYDGEGREVQREEIYGGDIKVGEKFSGIDCYCNDLPAGNYRLELLDY